MTEEEKKLIKIRRKQRRDGVIVLLIKIGFILFAVGCVVFGLWLEYKIATSDLPFWFKFALLK